MQHMFSFKAFYMILFLIAGLVSFSTFNGCDDSGIDPEDPIVSYVVHFDSIGVTDGIGDSTMNSINLYNGTTVRLDSGTKDCNLTDENGSFVNFRLRSGDAVDLNVVPGYQTKFNRIYASMTQAEFDTISVLPVGRDTINPELDFTADDTYAGGAWEYFNVPMGTGDAKPVYSFWLKGKSSDFLGRNVYGILYPREASLDNNGNFRMSFEVRINTQGINDFVHTNH